MKSRKEFNRLKEIIKEVDTWVYPGYPFSIQGVVDFKNKHCYIDNHNCKPFVIDKNWEKFIINFNAKILYHMIDSTYDTKGNWLNNGSEMKPYKAFLEIGNNFDDVIYFDNRELTKLYFAVWSAICEYEKSNKLMYFGYDGSDDIIWLELFDNQEQIEQYYKKCVLGE